jgi:hypothetical protein
MKAPNTVVRTLKDGFVQTRSGHLALLGDMQEDKFGRQLVDPDRAFHPKLPEWQREMGHSVGIDSTLPTGEQWSNYLNPEGQQQGGQELGEVSVGGGSGETADGGPDDARRRTAEDAAGNPTGDAANTVVQDTAAKEGLSFESAKAAFDKMSMPQKIAVGLGVTIGTIALLNSVLGDDEDKWWSWLGTALGYGTAAGVAVHGGMLGKGSQDWMQGIFGQGPTKSEALSG